jgi:hypothetical protein
MVKNFAPQNGGEGFKFLSPSSYCNVQNYMLKHDFLYIYNTRLFAWKCQWAEINIISQWKRTQITRLMTIPFLKIINFQPRVHTCQKWRLNIKEKFVLLKLELQVYIMKPHITRKRVFCNWPCNSIFESQRTLATHCIYMLWVLMDKVAWIAKL